MREQKNRGESQKRGLREERREKGRKRKGESEAAAAVEKGRTLGRAPKQNPAPRPTTLRSLRVPHSLADSGRYAPISNGEKTKLGGCG